MNHLVRVSRDAIFFHCGKIHSLALKLKPVPALWKMMSNILKHKKLGQDKIEHNSVETTIKFCLSEFDISHLVHWYTLRERLSKTYLLMCMTGNGITVKRVELHGTVLEACFGKKELIQILPESKAMVPVLNGLEYLIKHTVPAWVCIVVWIPKTSYWYY